MFDERGLVLLVRHSYGERNWELPGGGAEAHESAEDAARREAREEVGIELEVERLTGVYWEPGAAWANGVILDAHHFTFRARGTGSPHIADPSEITDLGWFAIEALPRPISDFTVLRIRDALSETAAFRTVGPRTWLR